MPHAIMPDFTKRHRSEDLQQEIQPIIHIKNKQVFAYESMVNLAPPIKKLNGLSPTYTSDRDTLLSNKIYIQKGMALFRKKLDKSTKNNALLFLKVNQSVFLSPYFISFIETILSLFALQPRQIVFEIKESKQTRDHPLLLEAIHHFSQLGFHFALGGIQAVTLETFKSLLELQPNYLKISGELLAHLDYYAKKQKMLEKLSSFCKDEQIDLIVEGVQSITNFAAIKALSIPYAQGAL